MSIEVVKTLVSQAIIFHGSKHFVSLKYLLPYLQGQERVMAVRLELDLHFSCQLPLICNTALPVVFTIVVFTYLL